MHTLNRIIIVALFPYVNFLLDLELKKGDVMDPCLEDLGSRYVGTWYARMQPYPRYGRVHAGIDTDWVQL